MHKNTSTFLINIKQRKDKPLKSYLARFNQATVEIKYLSPIVAMHSILVGLKSRDFSKSLTKKLVETITELLA